MADRKEDVGERGTEWGWQLATLVVLAGELMGETVCLWPLRDPLYPWITFRCSHKQSVRDGEEKLTQQ